MDTETLNALEQLWKPILAFGFIVVLLVGLILFRGQIAGLIDRVRSINVRYRELGELEAKVDQSEKDTQQIQEESVADVDDDSAETDPTTDDAFVRMIRAFESSDFTIAEQAYEEHQATVRSDDERRELEAHYLYLRYTKAADSEALAKLRELASHTSTKTEVLRWLADCYWDTRDYSKARDIYTEARDSADEINAAQLTYKIVACWAKEGDPDQGLEEVILKLREVEQAEAKLYLYKSMASMYQAKDSERMCAIMLEKALEFAPRDTDIRFRAAYAQNKAKLSAMSVTNYDILLTLEPKHTPSLNNLGVMCKRVDLPFKSVAYYKKAADEDHTLAMANLANLLMDKGFYEEADCKLSRASQLPKPHEKVASIKAQLEKRRLEELEKWTDMIKAGARQRPFLRKFAQALIEEATEDPFLGPWRCPNGETCLVESEGGQICLEFDHDGKRCRFEAGIRNRSAEGKLLFGILQEEVEALAAVSSDGTTLSILALSDSSTVIQMIRISDPT